MCERSWPISASMPATRERVIEVWNKIDQLDEGNRVHCLTTARRSGKRAHRNFRHYRRRSQSLAARYRGTVAGEVSPVEVRACARPDGLLDWLYRNGDVVSREDQDDGGVASRAWR